MITVERYHDFSAGHRVVGHEGACRFLHGHNYRVHFIVAPDKALGLDGIGRVLDFGQIKQLLCMWLEDNWDHRFLAWEEDAFMQAIETALDTRAPAENFDLFDESVVWLPFNPTAENMAAYLVEKIGPSVLAGTGVALIECRIEETRKCTATYTKGQ